MAWGVFYQTVNIGGFVGPLLAAQLRQLEWAHVFYACAAIISLNFLLLLTYKEQDKEERLAHRAKVKSGEVKEISLWRDSLDELLRPIMIFCFMVAGWSALIKATNSMALGTFLAAAALLIVGGFNYVWIIVLAIVCFSMGEMLASPKSSEYLGNIAPEQKKAMYLGFSQLPLGIGWSLEGFFGQYLYGEFGSKDTISRHSLLDQGMSQTDIDTVPIGEAFQKLIEVSGQSTEALTSQLYAANNVGVAWYIMGSVGLVAAANLIAYGRWTYKLKE